MTQLHYSSLALVIAAFAVGSCGVGTVEVDRVAVEEELLRLDREFDADSAERGSAAWVERFASDGRLVSGGNAIVGSEAIAAAMAALDGGQVTLRWQPLEARVAAHGDMGYTRGAYERRIELDTGPVSETGGYVTVWQQQGDGEWQIVLDVGSPDPRPAARPPGTE